MLLQSRAIDDTGYIQPTKTQLREVRGLNSIYHNNCIQTWLVFPMARLKMLKFLKPFVYASVLAGTAFPVQGEKYGLGRVALPEEIAAWDWDVSPDGTGLPIGSGDAIDGKSSC